MKEEIVSRVMYFVLASMVFLCCPQTYGLEGPSADQIAKWKDAAEGGQPEAQYRLGTCYENGQGVPQDYSVAAGWYQKAVD